MSNRFKNRVVSIWICHVALLLLAACDSDEMATNPHETTLAFGETTLALGDPCTGYAVITCSPGTNTLSACIDSASAFTTIQLTNGATYTQTDSVTIGHPDICIRPADLGGAKPIIKFPNEHKGWSINLHTRSHLMNLQILGPYANMVGENCSASDGAANCEAGENLHPGYDGLEKHGLNGSGTYKHGFTIDGCEVNGFRDNGIHGAYTHSATIRNSIIRNNGRTGVAPYEEGVGWLIESNWITNNGQDGIDMAGTGHIVRNNHSISHNGWTHDPGDQNGVLIIGTDSMLSKDHVVHNNIIEGNLGWGIFVDRKVSNVTISDNTVRNNAVHGIRVGNDAGHPQALSDIRLRSNAVTGNPSGAISVVAPVSDVTVCGTASGVTLGVPGANVIWGPCGDDVNSINTPKSITGLRSWVDGSQTPGTVGSSVPGSLSDLSGYSNSYYNVVGAAHLSTSAFAGFRSLYFNGSSSYGGGDALFIGNKSFTMLAAVQGWSGPFYGAAASLGCTAGLEVRPGGGQLWVRNVGSTPSNNAQTVSFHSSSPRILAVSQSSSTRTLFLDGQQVEDRSVSWIPASNCSVQFARDFLGDWTYASGFVGEIVIYNRTLSANEVAKVSDYLQRKWVPVPPPPLPAAIVGPSEVEQQVDCHWDSDVSGGATPFTYEWRRDGSLVSTGPSYAASTGTADFELELWVKDAHDRVGSDHLTVRVGSGPACII